MSQKLENDILQLRALEPEDLQMLYDWENNSEWWEQGNTLNPYSKYILREYIVGSDKTIYETRQLRLMITVKETGETVGMIDLYDYEPHHHRAGVGILIDKQFQQKHYATQAFEIFLPYCYNFLGIHSVFAHVMPDNKPSQALFEKLGFNKNGELKDWIRRDNEYVDVMVYQKLKG